MKEKSDSMEDINISGEKYAIKAKYDIDNIDIDKIDINNYNRNEPISLSPKRKSPDKLKEGLTKSSNLKDKSIDSVLKKKDDNKYCEIVKKYRLERRNHSVSKKMAQSIITNNDEKLSPKKNLRMKLRQKLSFSSTPKYNELKLISKEYNLTK